LVPRAANEIKIRLELRDAGELDLLVVGHSVKQLHQLRDLRLQTLNILACCERLIAGRGSVIHVGAAV
jgi:hypothetical protein